jgi:hypothetical protein
LLEVKRLLQHLKAGMNSSSSSSLATLEHLLDALVAAGGAAATLQAMHSNQAAASNSRTAAAAAAAQHVSAATLAAAFSRMSAQLQVCNENVHSFKALYARLASDRAELTREVVRKVMLQGTYTFTTTAAAAAAEAASAAADVVIVDDSSEAPMLDCQVDAVCSYPRSGSSSSSSSTAAGNQRQLQLEQLQEIRGRVLLLSGSSSSNKLNSPAGTAAATTPMEEDGAAVALTDAVNSSSAATAAMLSLFAEEVSVASEVAAVAGQLLELGCVSYSTWQQQLTAAAEDPTQRLQQLQQLLRELQGDLGAWQQQLAAAQARCRWLNYFHPKQQLFLLWRLWCAKGQGEELSRQEYCCALAALQFVQADVTQQQLIGVRARSAAAAGDSQSCGAAAVGVAGQLQISKAVQAAVAACAQLAAALDMLFGTHGGALRGSLAQSAEPEVQPVEMSTDSSSSNALVAVLLKDADASSVAVLLQARAAANCGPPEAPEVVFCSSSTNWWEVQLLLQRCCPAIALAAAGVDADVGAVAAVCSSSSSSSRKQRDPAVYALCDADALPLSLQSRLLQLLQLTRAWYAHGAPAAGAAAYGATAKLVIICSGSNCYLASQLAAQAQAAANTHAEPPTSKGAIECWLQVKQVSSTQEELGQLLQCMLQQQQCCVAVLTSDLSGQGKSTAAARLAAAQNKQLYHVLLTDDAAAAEESAATGVIWQLRGWNPEQQVLQLQLFGCSCATHIEQLLFGLLVLSHVSEGMQAYHRPPRPSSMVVEVGNSMLDYSLEQQIPLLAAAQKVTSLQELLLTAASGTVTSSSSSSGSAIQPGFWRLHCCFNLQQLDTTAADVQLLCAYLNLQETGQLDAVAVAVDDDGSLAAESAAHVPDAANCQRLLRQAFVAGREDVMTYSLLRTFVRIAARQLQHMSRSFFFQPSTLQWVQNGGQCRVRSQLLTAILQAAASFASDSCSAVRSNQQQQQQQQQQAALTATPQDAGLQLAARSSSIVGWSESNHLLLLFNAADDHQSITALYRQRQHVPHSFQQLLASQAVMHSDASRSAGGLVNYAALSSTELLDTLLTLVSSGSHAQKEGRWAVLAAAPYILTPDNLLKMSLIYMRVQAGLPVVMMGDTGSSFFCAEVNCV